MMMMAINLFYIDVQHRRAPSKLDNRGVTLWITGLRIPGVENHGEEIRRLSNDLTSRASDLILLPYLLLFFFYNTYHLDLPDRPIAFRPLRTILSRLPYFGCDRLERRDHGARTRQPSVL